MQDASAAILCGGKSRRMGFDKAFLKQGDSYLLQLNASRLSTAFGRVLLVSDSAQKLAGNPALAHCRVVEDHYPGTGPLGGICTALEQAEDDYVFIMACDMPRPDMELLGAMRAYLGQAQVVVCEHEGRLETLFAFYHRSCLPVFTQHIREGKLKPRQAFELLRVQTLPIEKQRAEAAFINLNTQQELARYLAQHSADSPARDGKEP